VRAPRRLLAPPAWRVALPALLCGLAACPHPTPAPRPSDLDSTATPRDSMRAIMFGGVADPVGFLLENRDSLDLTDAQLDQLRAINLDLFRHNARIQIQIDSLLPPPSPDQRFASQAPDLSPEQRHRVETLVAERSRNIRQARADAYTVLTPDQRTRAEALEGRADQRRARDGGRRPRG